MELIREITFDDFQISTDKSKLDLAFIHHYLCFESYWAKNIPLDILKAAIENSLCFGIYHEQHQIGFARLITDYATFGHLADVFVVDPYKGKGLGKKLIEFILATDCIKYFRRITLGTQDAHSLYAKFGFTPLKVPERFMELHQPDVYKSIKN